MTVENPEIASKPGYASFSWFGEDGNIACADFPKACIKFESHPKPQEKREAPNPIEIGS